MSQVQAQATTRGEFTRHTLPQERQWSKRTHTGHAVDGPLSWREDKYAARWLAGGKGPELSAMQREAIGAAWRDRLAEPLRRLRGGSAKAQVIVHEDCLECWIPLTQPEMEDTVRQLWVTAANTQTHLIAVNQACTKASIFIQLLQPTDEDVELVDAALRYIAVELRPILEVLRTHPGLAANWGRWWRASQQQEGGNHREQHG